MILYDWVQCSVRVARDHGRCLALVSGRYLAPGDIDPSAGPSSQVSIQEPARSAVRQGAPACDVQRRGDRGPQRREGQSVRRAGAPSVRMNTPVMGAGSSRSLPAAPNATPVRETREWQCRCRQARPRSLPPVPTPARATSRRLPLQPRGDVRLAGHVLGSPPVQAYRPRRRCRCRLRRGSAAPGMTRCEDALAAASAGCACPVSASTIASTVAAGTSSAARRSASR